MIASDIFRRLFMAYFLKQANLKGRTYLSIVESYYCPKRKGAAHRTYKSLESIETHKARGIKDPVAYFQKEVDKLNLEKEKEKVKLIGELSPRRKVGYFPLKAVMEKLKIREALEPFKYNTNFDFDLYSVLSSLVYARCVQPCSKHKTFHDVIPYLDENTDFSYHQLLTGLSYLGNDYKKFVELFTRKTKLKFGIDTSTTFFDGTNFYFEIDKEDDFKKNGPSKEKRHSPIVGLGLLLDANQIPIGMHIYPGNESEKPVLRNVLKELKEQNNITGRTIQVADKGLNCAQNILEAKRNRDGYIFSKSVKQLPEVEKKWILLTKDYHKKTDSKGNILFWFKECIDEFPYEYIDENGKKHTVMIEEKRVVTFNPKLREKKVLEIKKLVEKAKKMKVSEAKKKEYGESAKYIIFKSKSKDKVVATINYAKINEDTSLAGFNLLVTSELNMNAEEIHQIYHNLWVIEESFKIMKSDLDARPVFLQKKESIMGHFFICYVSVLLQRLLQFKVLKNKYSSNDLFKLFKDFEVVKNEDSTYINISAATDLLQDLTKLWNLPLTNYYLSEVQMNKIKNFKL